MLTQVLGLELKHAMQMCVLVNFILLAAVTHACAGTCLAV
jgi:hypothetical protein